LSVVGQKKGSSSEKVSGFQFPVSGEKTFFSGAGLKCPPMVAPSNTLYFHGPLAILEGAGRDAGPTGLPSNLYERQTMNFIF
jgi:hypothetical protein